MLGLEPPRQRKNAPKGLLNRFLDTPRGLYHRGGGGAIQPRDSETIVGVLGMSLEEIIGVDVDGEAETAACFRHVFHPEANIGLDVGFARRLDQEPEAITSPDHR